MKTPLLLLGLLGVGGLAAGVWFLFQQGETSTPPPTLEVREPAKEPPKPTGGVQNPTAPQPTETPAGRTAYNQDAARADLPQGFQGVVVDNNGGPVANARVSLVHGFQVQNFFQALQSMKRGNLAKVESSVETDASGRFKLPCGVYSSMQPFDVRVQHPRFVCVDRRTELRVVEGQYKDIGRIGLKPGISVTGRVTIESSGGAPVPGARVRLSQGNGLNFLRMPGHESGIEVQCDPTGVYRFDNVEVGTIELDASAKGYSLVRKSNILVQDNQQPTTVDFELGKGFELAGFVTDAQGQPIANAQVTGDAISTKNPMTLTRVTDRTGAFELVGLPEGQYFVSVDADGFVKADRRGPFNAGEKNAQLVLEKQGAVRVFVTSSSGAALRRFTLEVKRFFPAQPENFGPVPEKFPIEVRSAPTTGYLLEGLNPESYVVMVEAPEHSKKYSEPVTVTQGGEIPEVRVQLSKGGTIAGRIVAANGQPIANAVILTRPNTLDENPFIDMIGGLIHKRITETQVVTGNDGRFKLSLLIPDTYQLRITHKDHYRTNQKDIQVADSQVTDLGDVKLSAGVRVKGVVYVNGQPKGGVEVNISVAAGATIGHYSEKAVTDEQGRFAIDNPLPPGQYEATASRTDLSSPILKIADFTKSKKAITLFEGTANPDVILEINDPAK
jgi:uncharacterized GH25 family protein